MNVETLTIKVHEAVQDDSFTDEFILGSLNKCLGELASVYTLPDLITSSVVTCLTGEKTVSLPADYLKNVIAAVNQKTNSDVKIIDDLPTFFERHPLQDEGPPVDVITVQGQIIYYQGIPTDPAGEDLRLYYIRKPVLMASDSDEPEGVPEFLHEDLFYNYACAQCFALIEEGIDGAKINFNKYMSLYQAAQVKLEQFLGVAPEAPDFVPE